VGEFVNVAVFTVLVLGGVVTDVMVECNFIVVTAAVQVHIVTAADVTVVELIVSVLSVAGMVVGVNMITVRVM